MAGADPRDRDQFKFVSVSQIAHSLRLGGAQVHIGLGAKHSLRIEATEVADLIQAMAARALPPYPSGYHWLCKKLNLILLPRHDGIRVLPWRLLKAVRHLAEAEDWSAIDLVPFLSTQDADFHNHVKARWAIRSLRARGLGNALGGVRSHQRPRQDSRANKIEADEARIALRRKNGTLPA